MLTSAQVVKMSECQQFYSELHLLDQLMTGLRGSNDLQLNIKNLNVWLFPNEFNRKCYQTLKAKHSGKEHGLKYCIVRVDSLLLPNGVLLEKIALSLPENFFVPISV